MTQEQFDIAFKHFTRFLKELGYYTFVINYLFPQGRTKEDLLDAINGNIAPGFKIAFVDILNYEHVLGPNYVKLGGWDYWNKFLSYVHETWKKYVALNYPQYRNKI